MKPSRTAFARALVLTVAIGLGLIMVRWAWRANGGTLPSMSALRIGMTKVDVESIVGRSSFEGERPDRTSDMVITRPESLYWIQIDFDAQGRLRSYSKECF